jgi:signal transduction histidine kinase/ActR/RegA family two-component response regulator
MQVKIEPDFQRLFSSAPGLYLVLDPDLRIVAVTDAYLEATMTEREELIGECLFDVFPDNPDDPDATGAGNLRASLERVRRTGLADSMGVQKYDIRRPAAVGGEYETRYWSPFTTPILDDMDRVEYLVYRVVDVTEFVRLKEHDTEQEALTSELQERAERMEDEIVRRSRELQKANDELRAANAAKNDFLARMSHELRSPLTAISGFAELLSHSDLDPKQRERLSMVRKGAEHLHSLINEVLDLSRIESGNISISPEMVSLQPMVTEALDLMRPIADAYFVDIEPPRFAPGCGYAFADNQRMKQVIINLVSNAIKYNRGGGYVRVELKPAGDDRIRISVTDTGKGLDENSIGRLFVPFERLDAASTGIEGTGLGLALSRTLVEAMGGTIGVESKVGVGSRFWVDVIRGEPVAVHRTVDGNDPLLAIRLYPHKRNLLYFEDTVANVRLIEGILERRPSVHVLPAMLGRLGLEIARGSRPDLILMDLHLPDMGGDEVLAQLRADERTRDIPVIILSADAKREREPLIAAGAQAYLTKPIGMRRLLEVLDHFLGEPAHEEQEHDEVGAGFPARVSSPVV